MTINVSVQRISKARAQTYKGAFSTVEITTSDGIASEVSLFFHNEGHMDTAARIAALINDDAARPKPKTFLDELEDDTDEQQLEEQAQEDRRQALNDELGPRAAAFPYEEEQALEQGNKLRDFDGEVF